MPPGYKREKEPDSLKDYYKIDKVLLKSQQEILVESPANCMLLGLQDDHLGKQQMFSLYNLKPPS